MKKKIVENYSYEGLGFPVNLSQVEMVYINNEWHPKIDVRKVSEKVIKTLVSQEKKLTGNQIKFIRTYFSMTLREFAKNVVHESHTAVNKWERFENKATNMDPNIEAMLRLYIYEKTCVKTEKQKSNFFKKYLEIKRLFPLQAN